MFDVSHVDAVLREPTSDPVARGAGARAEAEGGDLARMPTPEELHVTSAAASSR